jgi:4-alpha-glucanotransferase
MKASRLLQVRASGVLLHPTSLPGAHGCGDLGPAARRFVDFLARARQHWWQMLPVHPPGRGNSPYNSISAFAGSALLVSPEDLRRGGLLTAGDLSAAGSLGPGPVDFVAAARLRTRLLRRAFERCLGNRRRRARLDAFRAENAPWLEDYALYRALGGAQRDRPWYDWDGPLRDRQPAALRDARARLGEPIAYHEFLQYCFAEQWGALRAHAAGRGVALLGDLPIFVALESADVWARRDQYFMDARGRPTVVAGVPPDAFSRTGQRWGNPLYRWELLRRGGYRWWLERIAMACRRFDIVRLDHFIGFQRYWEIPGRARTALHGRFRPGPGAAFFRAARAALGDLPFVAEDLGIVTPEVTALREQFDMPGLRVLQFGFDGDPARNLNLPHHFARNCVAYTGTHDNDTTVGWFRGLPARGGTPEAASRARVLAYVGGGARDVHWSLLRAAAASAAGLCMVPMQDLLGLGGAARMNRPGIARGNWAWRLKPDDLQPALAERLGVLTEATGRAPRAWPPGDPSR